MTYITTMIPREKLRSKEFESDMIITIRESTRQIDEKEFYSNAVQLLALIFSNSNELSEEDYNDTPQG